MKKYAFTLAEVLITLGIIGIVAALTIPTLARDIQKRQWVNGFKVGVSTVQEGFKRMMVADGVDNFFETDFFINLQDRYSVNNKIVKSSVQKHFKVSDIYDRNFSISNVNDLKKYLGLYTYQVHDKFYSNINLSTCYYCYAAYPRTVYKLSNGTLVSFSKANGARSAYVYMDVNGIAGPNIAGRDIFVVRIFSDGIVRGNCSNYLNDCTAKGISEGMNFEKEQAQANLDYYQNEPLESWETQEDRNRDIQWATEEVAKYSNLGSYVQELSDNCLQPYSYDNWRETCSFRLMNNGWKMDY